MSGAGLAGGLLGGGVGGGVHIKAHNMRKGGAAAAGWEGTGWGAREEGRWCSRIRSVRCGCHVLPAACHDLRGGGGEIMCPQRIIWRAQPNATHRSNIH